MRNIKLLEPWGQYAKGDWAGVSDKIAENLIDKGIAMDPSKPKPEPVAKPAAKPIATKPKTTKKKVAKKKASRKHPVRRAAL